MAKGRALIHLKLAILSLLRNKRRTAVSLFNLAITLTLVLMFEGFAESMFDGLRESMIRSQLGHAQIFASGFNQYGALSDVKLLLTEQTKQLVIDRVSSIPGVVAVAPRLETDALLANGAAQMSVHVTGIDSDREAVISSAVQVREGSELLPENQDGIMVGQALAEALGIKPGDELTLLGTSVNQTVNAVDVVVCGIITTGVLERDLRTVFANNALMERFLLSRGASRIVLLLDRTDRTGAVMDMLKTRLAGIQQPLELRSWEQLATYYHQVVTLFGSIFLFVKVILLAVGGLAISNALSMSVVERTREIGVVRAIGGGRMQISVLFLLEGAVLGCVGGGAGVLASLGAARLVHYSGLMMPTPPGSTITYPMRILLSDAMLMETFLTCVGVALLASLLPAIRAAHMNIVEALGHA